MLSSSSQSRLLLLLAFLTVLAVLLYDYLPNRKWAWLPGDHAPAVIYSDTIFGGTSEVRWIDQEAYKFACSLKSAGQSAPVFCGIRIDFNKDVLPGVDLTDFHQMDLNIEYEGHNKKLRFYILEFIPGYSSEDNPIHDGRSKYMGAYVPSSETRNAFKIKMSEFLVADWWVNNQDVPREFSNASRENIVSFGVDIAYPAVLGEHEITIKNATLVGHWISAENWYLGIVLMWVLAITGTAAGRLYYLRANNSQLQSERNEFMALSMRDALTGLYNRNGLNQFVADQAKSGNDSPITILLLDIDHFKSINDSYGHVTGDAILKRLAEQMKRQSRETDCLARWGGEEFVVLLSGVRKAEAAILAERMRKSIESLPHPEIGDKPVTVSIGVGCLDRGLGFNRSFEQVDAALYRAKSKGRNRVA